MEGQQLPGKKDLIIERRSQVEVNLLARGLIVIVHELLPTSANLSTAYGSVIFHSVENLRQNQVGDFLLKNNLSDYNYTRP